MSIDRIYRIKKEIEDLYKNPLDNDNIFIEIDDEDISIIKCLIIGTKNTPYMGGFFLFSLRFPEHYPMSPPIVWFYTTKSNMRINPNLYINGKVCLSIINTWGNSSNWTPSMTIRSILISIQSMVLINNPLYNEPGIAFNDKQVNMYNKAVKYYVCDSAIKDILMGNLERFFENRKKIISFEIFRDKIKEYFTENIEEYITSCRDNYKNIGNVVISCPSPLERFDRVANFKYIANILINYYNDNNDVKLDNKYSNFNSMDLQNKLKNKKKPELQQICRDFKIKKFSKLNKKGLIELITLSNIELN